MEYHITDKHQTRKTTNIRSYELGRLPPSKITRLFIKS